MDKYMYKTTHVTSWGFLGGGGRSLGKRLKGTKLTEPKKHFASRRNRLSYL